MKTCIIRDISTDLRGLLPEFVNHPCIVIISRYNTGKTTSATDLIFDYFSSSKARYITLIDQNQPRKNDLCFDEIPKGKIIIFDELSDEKERNLKGFLGKLIRYNRVIILTNPYSSSNRPKKEIRLFMKQERDLLPSNTLFVYITNLP